MSFENLLSQPLSLLWPDHADQSRRFSLAQQTIDDLALEETINAFDPDRQLRADVRDVLTDLTTDLEVIRYRQAIVKDLINSPDIIAVFEEILPKISAMTLYSHAVDRQRTSLQQLAWRASELENLVETVNAIKSSLESRIERIHSIGLKNLYLGVATVAADSSFRQLEKELPEVLPKLRANVSVTIGVNLDRQLRPVEAVLLEINEEKFVEARFLERLLGRATLENGVPTGLAPIHRAPQDLFGIPKESEIGRRGADPLMAPLFRDLADVLDKIVKPIDKVLKKFVAINGGFLNRLRHEIGFYTAACRLYHRLTEQNLPLCFPEIETASMRISEFQDSYNLNLVRHLMVANPGLGIGNQVIRNDCLMGNQWGRIFILTGPNQGGKTTYTQMVGLNQILAQSGLFVPGRAARISPTDAIFTHYPVEEKLEKSTGRFGDEAQRLAEIFRRATGHSLILLNESLASTNPGESIYLAQDIVKIFRQIGLRAIYNTHLHELAENLEAINDAVSGDSRIASIVASKIEPAKSPAPAQRSFKVAPGPPMGRSYALEIAARYGIRYDQLQELLEERGLLNDKSSGSDSNPADGSQSV